MTVDRVPDPTPPKPDREQLTRFIAIACGVSETRAETVLDGILDVVAPIDRRAQRVTDRVHEFGDRLAAIGAALRLAEHRLHDLAELVAQREAQS